MYDWNEFCEWLDKQYYDGFHNGVMDIPDEDFYALEEAFVRSLN